MKIEAIGEEKILVALSDKDLTELDITYDEMDYSNIETRRVIWTILDEAKRSLGKSIDTDGRILIEVTPSDDGGCIMCFTTMPGTDYKSKKKLIMKKEAEPILFIEFDSAKLPPKYHLHKYLHKDIQGKSPHFILSISPLFLHYFYIFPTILCYQNIILQHKYKKSPLLFSSRD